MPCPLNQHGYSEYRKTLRNASALLEGRSTRPLSRGSPYTTYSRDVVFPRGAFIFPHGTLCLSWVVRSLPLSHAFVFLCSVLSCLCLLSCQSPVLSVRTSRRFHPVTMMPVLRVRTKALAAKAKCVRNTSTARKQRPTLEWRRRQGDSSVLLLSMTLCPENLGAVPAGACSTKFTAIANRANSNHTHAGYIPDY